MSSVNGVPQSLIDESAELAQRFAPPTEAAPQPPIEVPGGMQDSTNQGVFFQPNTMPLTPEQQQVPNALRPNATAELVPSSINMGSIPTGLDVTSLQPQQPKPKAAPGDSYATPQAVQAAPAQAGVPNVADNQKAFLDQYGVQQGANTAIAKAESDKAQADATAMVEAQKQTALAANQLSKLHNEFEGNYNERVLQLDGISKQLASQDFTAPKIDEGHFWASRSTPQSIMAGIAIALGAVGGGFSGNGKNSAVDVINKAIDRDIDVQKFNAQKEIQEKQMKSQNLRDQAGVQNSLMSHLQTKYSDDTQAVLAMKNLMLEQTQQQLHINASKSESVVVKKRAAILDSQLEQQKQQVRMQLKQQMYQRQVMQQALGSGDPTKISPEAESYLDPESRKILNERRERYIPGWGEATTKEGATKFREATAETRTALDNISEIKKLSEGLHGLSPMTDRARVAEIRTRLASLTGNLNKSLNKTSRLSDVDVHLIKEILGDPTANTALKSVQLKKLQTVEHVLQNDINNLAESHGIAKRSYSDVNAAKSIVTPRQ